MLHSLCMKFQAELVIFKMNLKIVFCVKHFHLVRTRKFNQAWPSMKNLKMYLNDIITNILHQFYVNTENTIIYMQQNMKHFWSCPYLIVFVHNYNYFVKLSTRQNIFKLFERTQTSRLILSELGRNNLKIFWHPPRMQH